jgi:hypothetical protein
VTEPLTILDPELVAELEQPCEWYQARPTGGIEPVRCDRLAVWMLLSTCLACGDLTTQLVCDWHHGYVAAGLSRTYCEACGRHDAGLSRTVERLR